MTKIIKQVVENAQLGHGQFTAWGYDYHVWTMYVFGFVSLFANSERLAIFFYAKVYTQVPVVRPIGSIIRVFMITLVRSPHEGLLRRGSIFPVVSRATIDKQTVHQFRSSR